MFQGFQNVLVYPSWLFSSKGMGNIEWRANQTIPSLPPEFSTQATIFEPYTKIKIQPAMFAVFLVIQGLTLVFVGGVVGWVWLSSGIPLKTSSFPLFDIAFKVKVQHEVEEQDMYEINESKIVQLMRDARVVGRSEVCDVD